MDDQQQIIYSFPRIPGEEIQIAIRTFRGKQYVDMRIWFESKPDNVLRPTKKGIYFSLDKVADFRKGIERLAKATRELKTEEAAAAPEPEVALAM
ncbi:MAG: transcriptional coactivator p15/PC4 family protein [Candidatus Omnitrophota bacterium]|jgi:phage terminase large subunit-like protein